MSRSILPKPVNDTEASLRSFLYLDLFFVVLAVAFRIFMLDRAFELGTDNALFNIVTMMPLIIVGAMVILMAGLIQHERAKAKRSEN